MTPYMIGPRPQLIGKCYFYFGIDLENYFFFLTGNMLNLALRLLSTS